MERSFLRRFVARFLGGCGVRRPLWETAGNREGIGEGAPPHPRGPWSLRHDRLEDLYLRYRPSLETAELLHHEGDFRTAWWVLGTKDGLLVPVISVENEDLLPPEGFSFDYADWLGPDRLMTVMEYDFRSDRGNLYLSASTRVGVDGIPYRGFRLYIVE